MQLMSGVSLFVLTAGQIDPAPIPLSSRSYLVPRDLSEYLQNKIEHTQQVPKGYVLFQDNNKVYKGILVPEDDLLLVDRILARGDVVKKNPWDAQSGTVIGNSSSLTVLPQLRMTRSETRNAYTVGFLIRSSPIPNIDSEKVLPDRNWNLGDWVIYQEWVGIIGMASTSITVVLASGAVVLVEATSDVKAVVSDLTGLTAYKCTKPGWKQSKGAIRLTQPEVFYPGQRVRLTKKQLMTCHWLSGIRNTSAYQDGVILNVGDVQSTGISIDWKRSRCDGRWAHVPPKPANRLPAYLFESGAVRVYDPSHNLRKTDGTLSEDLYRMVHNSRAAGDCVLIKEPALIESICKESAGDWQSKEVLLSSHERSLLRVISDELVLVVIATQSRVRVQWQDHSITEEPATSLCPYTEVDDYDVWPGELVSLKDQEESILASGYEKMIRTRMVGVVQDVNAVERVARVRWFQEVDLTIAGEFQDDIVWPHSQIGTLTDNVTDNSLYELANYLAIVRRRGDLVCITRHAALDLPSHPISDISSTTSRTALSTPSANEDINWFGEIIDLTLDGRLVVRLGALEHVRDVVLGYMDISVASSADDDTDDSIMSEMDTSTSEAIIGLPPNPEQVPITTSIEYDGPTPSDVDERQWLTDSNGDDSIFSESPIIHDSPPVPAATTDVNKNSSGMCPPSFRNRSDGLLHPDFVFEPESFEVLDGSCPNTIYSSAGSSAHSSEWLRAVRREHQILQSSLPERVYVRSWESSIDIMRVLIVGPLATPYALAPFLFDVHLDEHFPNEAPKVYFHSWTSGIGRVNPNLYEDGKVCLSLLGTWHSDKDNETWVPGQSSILQIIVSLLGLVLVKEPFYNEAGFETLQDTMQSKHTSAVYSEKAFVLSRGFVAGASSFPDGFLDIIRWLYLPSPTGPCLLRTVVEDCRALLQQESTSSSEAMAQILDKYHITSSRLSLGASVLLRKTVKSLESLLASYERLATCRSDVAEELNSGPDKMDLDDKERDVPPASSVCRTLMFCPKDLLTVKGNYKPDLRPNYTTRIRPSQHSSDSRVDLTIDNQDDGTKYQYTGTQQPSGACALIYDPATKTLMLDKMDADFTFNLQATPTNSNRSDIISQYPQLDMGISDVESEDGQNTDAPHALVGLDVSEADANNPYDYRHFLKRQRSSSPEPPPSRPSASPAIPPRRLSRTHNTNTNTAKPKPRPRASQPRSARKIEKLPVTANNNDSDSDNSDDGGLIIEMEDTPKRRRFGNGAVVFNHDRRNGPVSLRSAASSMSPASVLSPASVRQDSGVEGGDSDRDVESLKLGSPARRPGVEQEIEDDEDDELVGDLLQAMEGQADDEDEAGDEDAYQEDQSIRRTIEESSSESEEE
ncbi:MAG: hypothetical protein Q9218_006950 [Villophora microphyllina]